MKDLSELQHFIGCDVSKDTLDFAIHERGKDYRLFNHIQVPNSKEGYQSMHKWLSTYKMQVRNCVIAMEHTGFYSSGLAEWCFSKEIPFVFLHPLDVKNACSCGRNKTDKIDAQFIADYVYTMREKLSSSVPEPQTIKTLRQLRNERQMAVRTRTAYINLLKNTDSAASRKRLQDMTSSLARQIKEIERNITETIGKDKSLAKNYTLLLSVPGIGLVNAVTTIVATGNFTRFRTARQYAKFSCVSPMLSQSGISVRNGAHVSKAGHGEIKSLLTEAARSAIIHDAELKAYYHRKREQGKSHGVVMNAVKFKLICRMFAVVQRQTPYADTNRYRE